MIETAAPTSLPRPLTSLVLLSAVGRGLFITISAIYFVRVVELSPVEVGIGLTVAGLLGLTAGVPLGHLSDIRGPRGLLIGLLAVNAVATAAYAAVHTMLWFIVVAAVVAVAERGISAIRAALVAGLGSDTSQRSELRAKMRALHNIGIAVGSGLGAATLAIDTEAVYRGTILLDAATYLGAAGIATALPKVRPGAAAQPGGGGSMLRVFRDPPFVAVVLLSAVLGMHYAILDVALPLWVVTATDAPRWVVPIAVVINTGAVIALQVRVSRRYVTVDAGAKALRYAGVLLLLACLTLAWVGSLPAVWAAMLVIVAAIVHVAGELLQAAGMFTVAFELSPDGAHGQYQGLMSTSWGAATMLAPMVLTLLCIEWGEPGWIVIGIVFATVALAYTPVVRWFRRSQERLADDAVRVGEPR